PVAHLDPEQRGLDVLPQRAVLGQRPGAGGDLTRRREDRAPAVCDDDPPDRDQRADQQHRRPYPGQLSVDCPQRFPQIPYGLAASRAGFTTSKTCPPGSGREYFRTVATKCCTRATR